MGVDLGYGAVGDSGYLGQRRPDKGIGGPRLRARRLPRGGGIGRGARGLGVPCKAGFSPAGAVSGNSGV